MSQKYKFKSLQIAQTEEKKEEIKPEDLSHLTVFETGNPRTIDFIKKDGTRQSFPYGHYHTAWFGVDTDSENNERVIKIFFATHLVTIKGYCLDELYNHLCTQKLKFVRANDERYLNMYPDDKPFVLTILIEWKKA